MKYLLHKNSIIILFIFLVFGFSCSTKKKISKKNNYASQYNPSVPSLNPDFLVYHKEDSSSLLLVRFYPGELLFNQTNEDMVYRAIIKFHYRLYNLENKMLVDSSTAEITLDLDQMRDEMVTLLPFKAKYGKNYILQIIVEDVKRKNQFRHAIEINKTDKLNKQNFMVRNAENNAPVFNNLIDSSTYFKIQYAHKNIDSLVVSYFKNDFNYPTKPSINISYKDRFDTPDTQFVYYLKDTSTFKLNNKGLYVFQVDTNIYHGISLSYFGDGFPSVNYAQDMVAPLKYLLTDDEYNEMLTSKNKKLLIDQFWLKAANENVELARNLIRIYYNREHISNYFFTSYKEGWKTDRGMIFIIYGLPDYIYKSDNTERWIYENEDSKEKIFFKFTKTPHPFSDNHYELDRNEIVRTYWREAIDSWRKGKPFIFE